MATAKINKISSKTQLLLDEKVEHLVLGGNEDSYGGINLCESPIEELMYLALHDLFKHFGTYVPDYHIIIIPQNRIVTDSKNYRTDILVRVVDNSYFDATNFAIECDGHEWHEKTKEQAANDKKRERDITKERYRVLRFAGSEINGDPDGCAKEVLDAVLNEVENMRFHYSQMMKLLESKSEGK